MLVVLLLIVLIYSIELAFVSEAVGVNERLRALLHIVTYLCVVAVGYFYWKKTQPLWMKGFWLLIYGGVLVFLISVNLLNMFTHWASPLFLDQLYFVRIFFTSPLPFLISLLLVRIPAINK
jgi:hypothetical protein